jgi:hypothetical protein
MKNKKYEIFVQLNEDGTVFYFAAGEVVNGKLNGILYGHEGGGKYSKWYVYQNKNLPVTNINKECFEAHQIEALLQNMAENQELIEETNKIVGKYLIYNKGTNKYKPRGNKLELFKDGKFTTGGIEPIPYGCVCFTDKKEEYMSDNEFMSFFNWKELIKETLEQQICTDEECELSSSELINESVMSLMEDDVYAGLFDEDMVRSYIEKIVDAINQRHKESDYCCEDYALANTSIIDCEICDECGIVIFPDDEAYGPEDGRVLCGKCSYRCTCCDKDFTLKEGKNTVDGFVCKECLQLDFDLIGKQVKLTEEFATEYYYDKPYANKVLIVVDLILSYKEDDIKKEFGYGRVILKDEHGNIYDDDIEQWGVEIVEKQTSNSVWMLEQYNTHFDYSSKVLFGIFDTYEKAKKAMSGFEDIYKDFFDSLYENGRNQWVSDRYDFGIQISEVKFNTFGEV